MGIIKWWNKYWSEVILFGSFILSTILLLSSKGMI